MPVCSCMSVCTITCPVPPICQIALFVFISFLFALADTVMQFSPWEPVLSIKLLRLNREVLEAKY